MKKIKISSVLTAVLLVLAAAVVLSLSACGKSGAPAPADSTAPVSSGEVTQLGDGDKEFSFEITFSDGSVSAYNIKTDEEIVGQALQALGLIDGDEGPYGLYVQTVGGETVEYENGGHFWAFYINGEYAVTGVDVTEIEPGASYAFKVD